MSLSHALTNALSGVTANSRAATVVASNLANLHTPGYGRREIELGANGHGASGGVRIETITRHMDAGLLADRRAADAAYAQSQTASTFMHRIEKAIGTPDEPGSLGARIAAFDASLTAAATRPDETQRLDTVFARASDLVSGLNRISSEIQAQRQAAEAGIAKGVRTLTAALEQVQSLNTQIQDARRRGFDAPGLLDQRQTVVDRISTLVPVREIPRQDGAIALVSKGGSVLLDRRPAEIEFTQANVIVADMTVAGGGLSSLHLNGEAVSMSGAGAALGGGEIGAFFAVRDDTAVDAQSRLDAVARDLVERFQSPSVDSTLATGDAGLFTDAGAAFSGVNETGLAARLSLNPVVNPSQGGATWRLRDGLAAAAPGPLGDATRLNAMRDALTLRRPLTAPSAGGMSASFSAHAGNLVSHIANQRLTLDQEVTFSAARQAEYATMLAADGVDSDAETQRLLLIEQAFAANARMIQTVDEMMQTLLRM